MEIREINSEKRWENFRLANSPQALFQGWLWGEVEKNLGGKIRRLGVYDNESLLGIFQINVVEARRGKFLHIRHGPILGENKETLWDWVFKFLINFAVREKAWFVRISPLIGQTSEINSVYARYRLRPAALHAMDAELAWVLDVDKTEDKLLAEMRKTTRYEIRRAEKLGVKVIKTLDSKDLNTFLDLYKQTFERHGFVPHLGIEQEFGVYKKSNKALLLLGIHEGKVIAGAIILFDGKQAVYHHGASVWSKIPAAYLVQWEAVKEAKKRGIKLYDFWGIAPNDKPNHPWRGITLFKTGFGGRQMTYLHAHDLVVSPKYYFTRTIETIRRIAKGY